MSYGYPASLVTLPPKDEAEVVQTLDAIATSLEEHRAESVVATGRELGSESPSLVPGALGTVGRTLSDVELDQALFQNDPVSALTDVEEGAVIPGAILGRGGMGVVREGRQVDLRRDVALKQIQHKNAAQRDRRLAAFLREAWVSASLEHPNIVPVHALCCEGGDPLLVMKRIEGTSWRALMDDDALARELGMQDRLAFHLEILIRVARAVHFAHSRGIVHLDIKPDNVMVGRHGEVYVVDWGLSASFAENPEPWLPRTSAIKSVLGTPGYVPPELAIGLGAAVGPTTDVFLLGAVAHRIVTGRPPNSGDTMHALLYKAFACEPQPYADEVAPELSAILHKAMAREPEDRYPSADAFRLELVDFLKHRDSNALLQTALARLDTLQGPAQDALSERGSSPDHGSTDTAHDSNQDALRIRRLETECRFGLEEALRLWPTNARATEGMTDLARLSIERALQNDDWRRASAALEWMPEPDPALRARIEAARDVADEKRRERAALRDLGSNQDIIKNARVRSRTAVFVGAGWGLWFFFVGWALRHELFTLNHPLLVSNVLITLVIYGGVMYAVRRSLMATQIDRRVLASLAVAFAATGLLWTFCWIMALPAMTSVALSSGFYVFFFMLMTMAFDRRLGWVTLAFSPLAFICFVDTTHTFEWQGAYVFVGAFGLAAIWRRDAERAQAAQT